MTAPLPCQRTLEIMVPFFAIAKLPAMHNGAPVFPSHAKVGMEHFMIDHIGDKVARHCPPVEVAADADKIAPVVVAAEVSPAHTILRFAARPCYG